MSWSAIVYGEFTMPASKGSAWRQTPLDASKLRGDLGISKDLVFLVRPENVADVIARLPNEPFRFVRVDEAAGRVKVRGLLDEDEFRELATEIACLIVAAGAQGQTGKLHFTSQNEEFLTTVSVTGARVHVKTEHGYNDPRASRSVLKARKSDGYRDVVATLDETLNAKRGGPPPAPLTASVLEGAQLLVHRDTLSALEAVPAERFMAVVALVNEVFIEVGPGMPPVAEPKRAAWSSDVAGSSHGPLTMVGANRKAIVAYLREPFAACEAAALRLLHRADPRVAEQLAIRHAEEPLDRSMASAVAATLEGCGSEASLEAVLRLIADDQRGALRALGTSQNGKAGEHALRLLKRAKPKVTKSTPFGHPAASNVRALISVVAMLHYKPASPIITSLKKIPQLRFDAQKALVALKSK